MKRQRYSKYKDSGVEWLGDVPEHWEVKKLSYFAFLKSGENITAEQLADEGESPVYGGNGHRVTYIRYTHEGNYVLIGRQGALCGNINYASGKFWASEHAVVVTPTSYVTDEGVPFLLGGDIREFRIDTSNSNYCSSESSDGPLRKSRLESGDLVVVRVGYPGVTAVVPPELTGANCASMMLIRWYERFCSDWLAYLFNSQVGRDQIEIVQYGAAQKQFNISHAVDFEFPLPPLDEQTAIVDYLNIETSKLDKLIKKVEEAIERLQEYRTALITAPVTGKIDVREVATKTSM